MEDQEVTATEELKSFGINEVKNGILVGPKPITDLAAREHELVKYLFDEWDFIYLGEAQYKDLTNTN